MSLKKDAENFVNTIIETMNTPERKKSLVIEKSIIQLEEQKDYIYRREAFNSDEENSAIVVHYQIGLQRDKELCAKLELFNACTTSSCYDKLRTEQQLGYFVFSGVFSTSGIAEWRILLQSNDYDPDKLRERILAWIDGLKNELDKMSTADFKDFKSSLVLSKQDKPKSCSELFERWKKEVEFPREEDFGRGDAEAAAVEKLQKKQVQDFYEEFITNSGKSLRRISVLIHGKKHKSLPPQNGIGSSGEDNEGRGELTKSKSIQLPKKVVATHPKTEILSTVETFREQMKGKVWPIVKKNDKKI